jgi:hypothetical protein
LLLTVEICWLVFVIFLRKKKSYPIDVSFISFSINPVWKKTNRHEQALHTYDYSTVYTYIYLKSKSFVKDIEFRSSSFSTPFCCGDRKKTKTKQKWLTRPFLIFKYFDFPANISPEYFHFVAYILYIYIVLLYYYYYYSLLLCWRWCCPVN